MQVHAAESSSQVETDAALGCPTGTCGSEKAMGQAFQLRDLRGVFNDTFLPSTIAKIGQTTTFPNGDKTWSAQCSIFASEKGYGPVGKFMFNDLSPEKHPYFFKGTDDIVKACPNYDGLSVESKKAFIILIFGVASNMESSCNPAAVNPGAVDGTARGLMQLWDKHEDESAGNCQKGDARDSLKTMQCSAAKIDAQLGTERKLFTKESHYAVFFPNEKGKAIFKAMSRFPGCR
jgi:hypothetical protein